MADLVLETFEDQKPDGAESETSDDQRADSAHLEEYKQAGSSDVDFKPVRAIFVPSQQRGRDVALYVFPDNHDLCYEWYYQLSLSDNVTLTYMCCGCKSLKTRNREAYPYPVAWCRIVNGYFTTDPEHPFRPHFCEPRNTPKATARRLIIERCNELRDNAALSYEPASLEVQKLLSRVSSENFADFSNEEKAAIIEQITHPSENGSDNARRVIQRAQQCAKQLIGVKNVRRKRYRCILCGRSREYPCGRRPPFNRHHIACLLAALMRYKALNVECAKKVYHMCSIKRKMLCKEHYVEAATSIINEVKLTAPELQGNDIDLNALHMIEGILSSKLVKHLNNECESFDSKEYLTARSISFFLNDTMAYCVSGRPQSSLEGFESGDEETGFSPLEARAQKEAREKEKIMQILNTMAPESEMDDIKDDLPNPDPKHALDLISEGMEECVEVYVSKKRRLNNAEDELADQAPGPSVLVPDQHSEEVAQNPFMDRMVLVEGRKLLELFRFCPKCGNEIESDGSLIQCSIVDNAPVVDISCHRCMDEERGKIRWEGISEGRMVRVSDEVLLRVYDKGSASSVGEDL